MNASVASQAQFPTEMELEAARDSLHMLPLDTIPLRTPGLSRAFMIKNVRLEPVIELFRDRDAGSGQIPINELHTVFPSYSEEVEADIPVLSRVAGITSFDVYSLRIELRRLGIPVDDHSKLALSERMRASLNDHMRMFTRPLVEKVYGTADHNISDARDIISLFANPNREEALKNLKILSKTLGIELHEIPDFLEEYGDIFLSLAYFRRCLDEIVPEVHAFINWIAEVKTVEQFKRDWQTMKIVDGLIRDLTEISTSITGRFESFDRRTKDFWKDITRESFQEVRTMIEASHTTVGGVLCGLAVKMNLWKASNPSGKGGPSRRLEFAKSEMLPSLAQVRELERSARGR